MSTDLQNNNDKNSANPGFRVIKSPEEKKSQAKNAISNLLAAMGSSMPQGLVSAVGGPLMAGLLAVLSCMTVVAIPAIYVGAKATGLIGSSQKKGAAMSFSKLFGAENKSVAEGMFSDDPDAVRAMNMASEGSHPDEATSLGLTIPEEVPGSKTKGEGEDENEDDDGKAGAGGVKVTDGKNAKKMDTSKGKMADWKSNFGGGEGGSGAAGGDTGIGQRTATGKQIALGGGGAGMGGGASGATAHNSKQGVKNSGLRIKSSNAGAYQGAQMAAGLSQRLPQVTSVDGKAGTSQAAFHGMAAGSGKAIAGGTALVDGGVVGSPGIAEVNTPGRSRTPTAPVPDAPGDSEDENSAGTAMMMMIMAIVAALALAFYVVAPLGRPGEGTLSHIAAWAIAIAAIAGLAAAFANMLSADVPAWAHWVFGGIAALVSLELILCAARGYSTLNSAEGMQENGFARTTDGGWVHNSQLV